MIDLECLCTQTEFAALVGVGQPAVSDLQQRKVFDPQRTAGGNLLIYCAHLREQAAGRGGDGELAANRAALAKTSNARMELRLYREQGKFADVLVIEQVLAFVGSQVASKLEPLPARIKMLCPQLTADDIKQVETAITEARNLAAGAVMALLAEANEFDDEDTADAGEAADL